MSDLDHCAVCDVDLFDDEKEIVCASCLNECGQIRNALEILAKQVRSKSNVRGGLGLEMSVALNIAERALKTRVID